MFWAFGIVIFIFISNEQKKKLFLYYTHFTTLNNQTKSFQSISYRKLYVQNYTDVRLNPHQCPKLNFSCHWPKITTASISATNATAAVTAVCIRFVTCAALHLWHLAATHHCRWSRFFRNAFWRPGENRVSSFKRWFSE